MKKAEVSDLFTKGANEAGLARAVEVGGTDSLGASAYLREGKGTLRDTHASVKAGRIGAGALVRRLRRTVVFQVAGSNHLQHRQDGDFLFLFPRSTYGQLVVLQS